MKLALYSICTLQFLSIQRAFVLARENGIEYLEIFPFALPGRTTTLSQLVAWEQKFGVRVCAVDAPFNYRLPLSKIMAQEHDKIEWAYATAWHPLFGQGDGNLDLTYRLQQYHDSAPHPYCVVHPDYLAQMDASTFHSWRRKITLAVENERPKKGYGDFLWNPYKIAHTYRPLDCKLVLDSRHISFANRIMGENFDPVEIFLDLRPEMIHFNFGEYIGYGAPRGEELKRWLAAFDRYQPEFLVIEIGLTLQPGKQLERLIKELRMFLSQIRETSGSKSKLEAA